MSRTPLIFIFLLINYCIAMDKSPNCFNKKGKSKVINDGDKLLFIPLTNKLIVEYTPRIKVSHGTKKDVSVYDISSGNLSNFVVETSAEFFNAAMFYNNLLIIGGFKSRKYRKMVNSVDLFTGKLNPIAPLNTPRSHSTTVVYQDGFSQVLYVIGGWNDKECLRSVEKLKSLDGQWSYGTPMKNPRTISSAAIFDNKIFVAGGITKRITPVEDIEVYDIKKDIWKTIAPMSEPKHRGALVATRRYLYYAGGLNASMESVNYMERYDPKDDTWTRMVDPDVSGTVAAISIKNKILIHGGDMQYIGVYDEDADTWSELIKGRIGHFLTIINVPCDVEIKFN